MDTLKVLMIDIDRARAERLSALLEASSVARFELEPSDPSSADSSSEQSGPGAGGAGPDVILLNSGTDAAAALERIRELRRTFSPSAVVLIADAEGGTPVADGEVAGTLDVDGFVTAEAKLLDRLIVAAVDRNRRMAELQRRVHELEVGERNLRMLVTTTSDGIMIVDMDGLICFANPAAEKLFGRNADQLIGEPFGFPLTAGDTTVIDLLRPGGNACVVELRATRTKWEGQPARLAALRDITERVRAEQQERELVHQHALRKAAEQSEQRTLLLSEATRRLAATLDDATALNDLASVVVPALADCCIIDLVQADATFERVAVAGHGEADELTPRLRAARPRFQASAGPARALSGGEPWYCDDPADPDLRAALGLSDSDAGLPDGMRAMLVPLIVRDEPVGAMLLVRMPDRPRSTPAEVLLIREIAQRAAVTIDNARLYRSAQTAVEAKADFLAVMSHELRTPLNAVIGYAELLMMGVPAEVPTDAKEQVGRIRTSASHLLRLINEILSYSSLEDGRAELDVQSTELAPLITDVAAMIQPLADAKGVPINVELPAEYVSLETDPQKLKQILINLVGNAVKFTDEGAVSVSVRTEAQDVVMVVHDTGCGIEEADLERVFHPFWQAEQSRTRKAEGTGLGLAVARRLAHLLAGDITLESIVGDGSQFTLRLPWRYPRSRRER